MTWISIGMLPLRNLGYSWNISMTINGHSVRTRNDVFERGDSEIKRKEDIFILAEAFVAASVPAGDVASTLVVSVLAEALFSDGKRATGDDNSAVVLALDGNSVLLYEAIPSLSILESIVVILPEDVLELAAESVRNEKLRWT